MANKVSLAVRKTHNSPFAKLPLELIQILILQTISSAVADLGRPGIWSDAKTDRPYEHHPLTFTIHALYSVCATFRAEMLAVTRIYIENLQKDCYELKLKLDEKLRRGEALLRVPCCDAWGRIHSAGIGPWASPEDHRALKAWEDFTHASWLMSIRLRSQEGSLRVLHLFLSKVAAAKEELENARLATEHKATVEETK